MASNEYSDFYFSTLADDPDLGELADEFADEMPTKIDAIQAAHRLGDHEKLTRLVHQLKGAAGSYGFSMITPFAARLEASLRSAADPSRISSQLDELTNILHRVRSKASCQAIAFANLDEKSAT